MLSEACCLVRFAVAVAILFVQHSLCFGIRCAISLCILSNVRTLNAGAHKDTAGTGIRCP